jgi:tetratricopeptide (TPR) repeat protein
MRFFILHCWTSALILIGITPFVVHSEAQTLDLQALAKGTRPAVLLLTIFDANSQQIGTGTGFLVSADGKLITNRHVIDKGTSASAKAENGAFFMVEGVLATDAENDLVVLKLQGKDLPYLTLSSSASIQAGTRIAVIGCPLGLEGSVTEGIISAVREAPRIRRILQITAAISPGSSGSPVVTADGKVIGVASAILSEGQSLNFAVPADAAMILYEKARTTVRPVPFAVDLSAFAEPDPYFVDPDNNAYTAAWQAGDGVKCLKHAQALVKRYPDHAEPYFQLADSYRMLGFADDEVAAYQQGVKVKPDDELAWSWLAGACLRSGRTAEAISAYRQAIRIEPGNAAIWANLGDSYLQSGRTPEAISAYEQAVKLGPRSPSLRFSLAMAYAGAGRFAEAIEAYKRAIKIFPQLPAGWLYLGDAYSLSGQKAEALLAYEQAVKVEPNSADAWYQLGLMYISSHQLSRALEALRNLERLNQKLAEELRTAFMSVK